MKRVTKKQISFLCLVLSVTLLNGCGIQKKAKAPKAEFVLSNIDLANDRSSVSGVVVDSAGNIYIAGTTDNELDLGNEVKLTKNYIKSEFGDRRIGTFPDFFLAKYNNEGIAQWVKSPSEYKYEAGIDEKALNRSKERHSTDEAGLKALGIDIEMFKIHKTVCSEDEAASLSLDSEGNIYVTGNFKSLSESETGMDFGNGVKISRPEDPRAWWQFFIVKYNSQGQAQWARTPSSGFVMKEPSGGGELYKKYSTTKASSIFVDSSGNIYVAGKTMGEADLDCGNGVILHSQRYYMRESSIGPIKSSSNNFFVVKYNRDGVAQWARSAIATGDDMKGCPADRVMADAEGNVYVMGTTYYDIDFGDGAKIDVNIFSGGASFFVKYNSEGTVQWVKKIASKPDDFAVDSMGNIYFAEKNYKEKRDFGNGVRAEGRGVLIVKFNSEKVAQWANIYKSPDKKWEYFVVDCLFVDPEGNIYLSGHGRGKNFNYKEFFLMKCGSKGRLGWTKIGCTSEPPEYKTGSLYADSAGSVYVAGIMSEDMDFGEEVRLTAPKKGLHFFVVKYSE